MSLKLSEFYDFLLPELPGCTTDFLDYHLRKVTREYCKATSCWRATGDPIDVEAGLADYPVYAPETQAEVVRITAINLAGSLLWRTSSALPSRAELECPPRYGPNDPPFTLSGDLRTLTLATREVPTADLAAALLLEAALRPVEDAKTLPTFLKSEHSEALRYGVLSRLMAMGKKPWTDRELALVYLTQWNAALGQGANDAQEGNTRAPLRVRKWM